MNTGRHMKRGSEGLPVRIVVAKAGKLWGCNDDYTIIPARYEPSALKKDIVPHSRPC